MMHALSLAIQDSLGLAVDRRAALADANFSWCRVDSNLSKTQKRQAYVCVARGITEDVMGSPYDSAVLVLARRHLLSDG
jgi:hypothetical protein